LLALRATAPARALSLCIAWSGGADSSALLWAAVALRDAQREGVGPAGLPTLRLRALHVDHGLQPAAAAGFVAHCRRWARRWRVPLAVQRVAVVRQRGRSLEEAARDARWNAFGSALRPGEVLLLAQHADDQLETSLLQWLRGAGPAGLAGMPECMPCGRGQAMRPWLGLRGESLRQSLCDAGVSWVEDPSNADPAFDRNYLRQTVLPALRARWPSVAVTAGRSARLAAAADALQRNQAGRDLDVAADGAALDLRVLRRWPAPRQAALLRAWLQHQAAPVPDERRLLQALQWIGQPPSASAERAVLQWANVQLRRHGQRLCLLRVSAALPDEPIEPLSWDWRTQRELRLPDWLRAPGIAAGGRLSWRADPHGEIDARRLPCPLWLRPAQGACVLQHNGHAKALGEVLREAEVPSWARAGVPLLWDSQQLLLVADLACDDAVLARGEADDRLRFFWQQHP